MKTLLAYAFFLPLLLLLSTVSIADEIRPAYLEIMNDSGEHYNIVLKLPKKNDRALKLTPIFPERCQSQGFVRISHTENAQVSRWRMDCEGGLLGEQIEIEGLEQSSTDILVRLQQDKQTQVERLYAGNNQFSVASHPSSLEVIQVYTIIGIEHILLGFDHLLFVFALLLIIKGKRKLVGAITAFTIAHSITLTLASLNMVTIALPPVEAVIALSILFLAVEIIHDIKGKQGIAAQYPWIVAFSFGLLHGFGFAGALAEIGLPQNEVPLALLFFNVGVELGQLAFVCVILLIGRILIPRLTTPLVKKGTVVIAYSIGSLASFWVYERTFSFLW
ncbi:HupE/UreJ family protein [Aliivibrio salmonicida]|uniref:HupE/UreJ family protein n=1 Tax=Aliivibrio salmonicida TaxID=40269 RepID=UPI003D152F61